MTNYVDVGSMWGIDYLSVQEVDNLTWAGKYISTDMRNRERYAVSKFTVPAVSQANCNRLDNGTLSCPKDLDAWGEPTDYVAATCIIYLCMKYYTGRVKNGVLSENTVRDTPLRPQKTSEASNSPSPAWRGVQQPCMANDTLHTSQNMSKAEALGKNATTEAQAVLEDFFFYKENPDDGAEYANITAPNECVGTFDEIFMHRFSNVLQSQFHVTCYLDPRAGYIVRCQETDNTKNMELDC